MIEFDLIWVLEIWFKVGIYGCFILLILEFFFFINGEEVL